MDEHTPTTESVRYAYVKFTRDAFIASTSELEQEFDRWLAQHDADVWDQGWNAGLGADTWAGTSEGNPYREGGGL